MQYVDDFLNRITMYRLVLWSLVGILLAALGASFLGYMPFTPVALLVSTLFILAVSIVSNAIFAKTFNAPVNVESVYITALILACIITPIASKTDVDFIAFAFFASFIATASKYVFAIGKKHVFNPAAIAVVATAFLMNYTASWWVGTAAMLPFTFVAGFLIVRKTQREDLAYAFLAVATVFILAVSAGGIGGVPAYIVRLALDTPIVFFAGVMLTEPLTTPPTRGLRICYGILVGLLFPPFVHVGSVYMTPELALVLGNVYSYIVSPKTKAMLTLKQKIRLTPSIYEFVFASDKRFAFRPGQYLEWTLGHGNADDRGNRRYFTIASSPTDPDIRLGVKFYEQSSSFKRKLFFMKPGDRLAAGGLAGDFTLPKNRAERLVFIAGGIGVTPFVSMAKYLIDKNDRRDVTFLYSNPTQDDIAYRDVFEDARVKIGMKTVYALTRETGSVANSNFYAGRITGDMIRKFVPDFRGRHFYISGTRDMVTTCQAELARIGVPSGRITTDFFPGFA
ncbi:MAG: oxidoreductase [Patescibacteria group bacterium]|nr:oxidoreductase [Patescibacteria group bacterium]MDE1946215.1 oxidoreductase [Patescibacteria group bacterium]